MTTIYTDYLEAYDMKWFDIANVNFLAMLVDYSYVPHPIDTIDDVTGLIIAVPYVITANDMVTLGMSELMAKAEEDIKAEIKLYPKRVAEAYRMGDTWNYGRYVVMFNPELEILCYCEPINEQLSRQEIFDPEAIQENTEIE